MSVLLVAALVLVWTSLASASCYTETGFTEITSHGKLVHYCKYKGVDVLYGSVIKTRDCMKCRCTKTGLSCCGFGAALIGQMMPNDPTFPCKPVANGCMVLWVKISDERKRCPRKLLN